MKLYLLIAVDELLRKVKSEWKIKKETYKIFFFETLKERDHLEYLGVDGKIILKCPWTYCICMHIWMYVARATLNSVYVKDKGY